MQSGKHVIQKLISVRINRKLCDLSTSEVYSVTSHGLCFLLPFWSNNKKALYLVGFHVPTKPEDDKTYFWKRRNRELKPETSVMVDEQMVDEQDITVFGDIFQ